MNNNQLGKELTRLRKLANLTQKELCDNICTQPTISKIEKGEIIPGIEILDALSIKLQVPTTYLIDILLTNDHTYTHKLMNEIEELTLNQKFETVYKIILNELEKTPTDPWFQAFLKWQYYLSSYHLKKTDFVEVIENLKAILSSTPKKTLNSNSLKDRILNTIGVLYASKGEHKTALFYYNKIISINKNSLSDSPRLDPKINQLRVIYNKTKTLYDMKRYEDAILSCKDGINRSIELENMSLIGNFYYYLAQCYEQQNAGKEQISTCYKRAQFFFELLNRELYIEIIKTGKFKFLN